VRGGKKHGYEGYIGGGSNRADLPDTAISNLGHARSPIISQKLIHRSAWKGNSQKFALTAFYEVRLPHARRLLGWRTTTRPEHVP
jgi:hypothetical protein